MRILFLSRWYPDPPDNGAKLRVFNLLRTLSRHHDVALLSFHEAGDVVGGPGPDALREFCATVRAVPYRRFRPSSARSLLGFLSPRPRWLVDTYSADMAAVVADEYQRHGCDVIIASELDMAPYAIALPGVPAILEEVEVAVFRDAARRAGDYASRLRAGLTWLKLTSYLRRILPLFAACTVVSEVERANLKQVIPGYTNVAVIPNAVDSSRYAVDYGAPRPNSLVYAGALTYSANYDAMRYFLGEVFPLIAGAIPDVSLRVTGNNAAVDLASLPSHAGVEYTGYLQDVRPVVGQSWASVVPLRVGGGTRLKILEAMALGTPVVSTSKGAEGLAVVDGDSILIADDAQSFVRQVIAVLRSAELRARLSTAGRFLVASTYDWSVVGEELLSLVDRICRPTPTHVMSVDPRLDSRAMRDDSLPGLETET